MKTRLLLLTLLGIAAALFSGWFIDNQKVVTATNPLQVPDNIDYYLAGVNYRAFNESGSPHMQLQTPYLEHYIREDISQLETPELQYFTDSGEWRLSAQQGSLQHASDVFELIDEARLRRVEPADALLLTTQKLIFRSRQEQLEVPQALQITTDGLQLQAANALMDMRNKRHEFFRVKAIYRSRSNHVPG